jgi:hypothetical protein
VSVQPVFVLWAESGIEVNLFNSFKLMETFDNVLQQPNRRVSAVAPTSYNFPQLALRQLS